MLALCAKNFAKVQRRTTKSLCEPLASSADKVSATPTSRTPRPSRRHDARASKRPSINGGSSLRGAVARQNVRRLPSRSMLATMACGESPRPGGQPKTWHKSLVDDLKVFRATKGSTEQSPLVFGVETVLWTTAAKKVDKWYRVVLEEAERCMVRWHEEEVDKRRQRHASIMGCVQGKGERADAEGGRR